VCMLWFLNSDMIGEETPLRSIMMTRARWVRSVFWLSTFTNHRY